ncbi:MAG: signal peptidase I [Acidimicrobiia bacterium]
MRVIRRVASALALYGVPIVLVLGAVGWLGLRVVRGVDPPVVTTTSTAMEPDVRPGDLVLLHEARPGDVEVGEIVALRDGDGDITIRRVVERDQKGSTFEYLLHADNRPSDGDFVATDADLIGEYAERVPVLGYVLVLFRTTAGQLLLAAVCFFGFAGAFRARFRRHHDDVDVPVPADPEAVPYGGDDSPATMETETETAMSITPAELRHVRFAQVRKGYDTEAVDRALESVADSIEELLHERHELVERVRSLESEIERYREVESTLSQTLTLAERAAVELKAEAQVEADRILSEARAELAAAQQAAAAVAAAPPPAASSSMPDAAFIELLGETRAIRSLLQALLVSGADGEPFVPRAARPEPGKPGW